MTESATPEAATPQAYGFDASRYGTVAADEDTQDADAAAMALGAPTDQDAETGPVAEDPPALETGPGDDH